ncbi:MAG TPA: hypothetical protein VK324_10075, partial [Tepidisphaeraceae bacterium]|nr:hypothetical protein [Tepidisphaeraceae bacterium]
MRPSARAAAAATIDNPGHARDDFRRRFDLVRVTSDGRLTDETVREDVAVVLIVPLDEVRAGMKLAAPVQNPEAPDQVLLKTGYMLEDSVVRRLRAIGIQAVLVEYPALDDLDKHLA